MGRALAGAIMMASSRSRGPMRSFRSHLFALAGLGLVVGCAESARATDDANGSASDGHYGSRSSWLPSSFLTPAR